MSHDAINRYLREDRLTSRLVWKHARSQIQPSAHGYVIFDDTVLDKNFSHQIELVWLQFSSNAHGLIKGIGLVNCVYVNPETGQYWVIDYRIYDPNRDDKSKLDRTGHAHANRAAQAVAVSCRPDGYLVCDQESDGSRTTIDSMCSSKTIHLYLFHATSAMVKSISS